MDETNRNFVAGHFFIVGGLVFTPAQIDAVDAAVDARRTQAGFQSGDSFKFDTNTRPEHVTVAAHRDAKRDVVQDLRDIGVRMIVSLVLHNLATSQPYDTQMEWSLNTLAQAYWNLLVDEQAAGMMLLDRDNDRFAHLEYLFQHGLLMHNGGNRTVKDRIRLFGMTSDNASNLSSAADIALGAFRYCANTAVGDGREPVALQMFPNLAAIMWQKPDARGNARILNYGYHPRPSTIRVPAHQQRYAALAKALGRYSLED